MASLMTGLLVLAAVGAVVPSKAQLARARLSPAARRDGASARFAAAIHQALVDKLGADALPIRVDADGGRVVLSGTVKQRPTQRLAEEVSLAVPGVEDVDNQVEIAAPTTGGPPVATAVGKAELGVDDRLLQTRVKLRLLDQVGVVALKVDVAAADSVVSVRGILSNEAERRAILGVASRTHGVGRVVDLLRVP